MPYRAMMVLLVILLLTSKPGAPARKPERKRPQQRRNRQAATTAAANRKLKVRNTRSSARRSQPRSKATSTTAPQRKADVPIVDYQRLLRPHKHGSAATKRTRPAPLAGKKRTAAPPSEGSQVQPGARRLLLTWLHQGRLFSLLLFVAAAGSLAYLFTSPRLQVRQVVVEGNSVLPDAQIAQLSGVQGGSIWFVDEEAAMQRLYQNAYIEQATLTVALPDRVTLQISERRPEVRWQIGNVQYLVDGHGRVLEQAQEPPEPETLVILDTSSTSLAPNDQLDPDALVLARALALRLPVEVGITPTMIGWDVGVGVYIKTATDQTIVFGQTENLDQKLLILHQLLADQTAFTYLDLRPSNPFYR